jgi:hypothetical protein
MQTPSQFARALGERACLVAWMFLMVANTVLVGLAVELVVFAVILSLGQITLIDDRTLPFLTLGFIAGLNFPLVMKLHHLGVAHLNFEVHENILNNASESWATMIAILLDDETTLKSHHLEKLVREIANAGSAAERQERRREAKAWLIKNHATLSEEDKEIVDEHLGYLKLR